MDALEKLIRENCWRFPKGYPDSQEDIDYLKTLIEQQLPLFSDEELDAITVKVKKETGVDLEKVNKNTKEKVLDIVGDDELTDEEIKRIKNLVRGFKFEEDFYNYTKSKGLSNKSEKAIFNKASQMGELSEVVSYIKSLKLKFEDADEGNILTLFNDSGLSDDFLLWLYYYTIGVQGS